MPFKSKEDQREYDRRYYRERLKGRWKVYLVVSKRYVGITSTTIKKRMYAHKRDHGWTDEKIKVLASFKRPEPAIILEALLHWFGYKGCEYGKTT